MRRRSERARADGTVHADRAQAMAAAAGGLPCGIHVAAYAGRVDLLRALVLGLPATPYVDAVFADIQLPDSAAAECTTSRTANVSTPPYEMARCAFASRHVDRRQSCELWNPEE